MTKAEDAQQLDRVWEGALRSAWGELTAEDQDAVDLDTLEAYLHGDLTEEERADCEAMISKSPRAMARLSELWKEPQRTVSPERPKVRSSARFHWYVQAACLAMAAGAAIWAVRQGYVVRQRSRQVVLLEHRLAEAQREVAVLHKEDFLWRASSPIRAYWVGDATPEMLALEPMRGEGPLTDEAKGKAERARQAFSRLEQWPALQEHVVVELAFLDIVSGRTDAAEERLQRARQRLGDTGPLANAQAVLYLARRDRESYQRAEALLRQTTQRHPDYLPAWYNLAIVSGDVAVWEQYLKRETRAEYRRVAEDQLSLLR